MKTKIQINQFHYLKINFEKIVYSNSFFYNLQNKEVLVDRAQYKKKLKKT